MKQKLYIKYSLAPGCEFYISNLTKVKYSSLTIFLHKSSPLLDRNSQPIWSAKSERRTFQKIGFFVKYKLFYADSYII